MISINIPSARVFHGERQAQLGLNSICKDSTPGAKVAQQFLSESQILAKFFDNLMPHILQHLDQYFRSDQPSKSITSAVDGGVLTINNREFNVKVSHLDIPQNDRPFIQRAGNLELSLQDIKTGDYIVLATKGSLDKASLDYMHIVDKQNNGSDEAELVYHTDIPDGMHVAKIDGFKTSEQCISIQGTSFNSSLLGAMRYVAKAGN